MLLASNMWSYDVSARKREQYATQTARFVGMYREKLGSKPGRLININTAKYVRELSESIAVSETDVHPPILASTTDGRILKTQTLRTQHSVRVVKLARVQCVA